MLAGAIAASAPACFRRRARPAHRAGGNARDHASFGTEEQYPIVLSGRLTYWLLFGDPRRVVHMRLGMPARNHGVADHDKPHRVRETPSAGAACANLKDASDAAPVFPTAPDWTLGGPGHRLAVPPPGPRVGGFAPARHALPGRGQGSVLPRLDGHGRRHYDTNPNASRPLSQADPVTAQRPSRPWNGQS